MGEMRNIPKCPYCGKEMKASIIFMNGRWTGEYKCRACHAFAPSVDDFKTFHEAKEAAYEAAMQRPLQEPIPLEEIEESLIITPCWVEFRDYFSLPSAEILDRDSVDIFRQSDHEYLKSEEYRKTWRAWYKFPSYEERMAEKWD